MRPEDLLDTLVPVRPAPDAILVVGGGAVALDLLRLATVRSDEVVLVADRLDPPVRRYAERFAVVMRERAFVPTDLAGVSAALVALGDVEGENDVVRAGRARAVPVHVAGRLLVSDFTLIDMLERKPWSFAVQAEAATVAALA